MKIDKRDQNVFVIFEVRLLPNKKDHYLELAEELKHLLNGAEGLVRTERFVSLKDEDKLLSLNVWKSEKDVDRWRNTIAHRISQKEGRSELFESYRITVAHTVREYGDKEREEAPEDSNKYFLEENDEG
ncbi:antibiotic biosynthesis monooxygenase family protein [Turicimonas muris]|uniref:antibiotic biosynthesis monooxygenase family protein n=1 Tax=Turicimonas muris TaxID=1796652 RepID=UPI0023F571CD|nr:antibiotic biosynthesis monooxygenase [Turicimonas muris]